jgi:uncharacterized OB-fold protein
MSGTGRVYSFTVMRRAYHPGLADSVPYTVAVIELDEGVRMVSNVVECRPEDVLVGMDVAVVFSELTPGVKIPRFTPRSNARGATSQEGLANHV